MPYPDNFSSSAFHRAWGADRIMPRELNRDECATVAVIASAQQIVRAAIRDLQRLPTAQHPLVWGPVSVIETLRGELTSLEDSGKDIRRIPQDEADEANDRMTENL